MSYVLGPQSLDWTSASRIFATTKELFDSQPNYEHEVAIALDTRIKYQGSAPVVGGWKFATGATVPGQPVIPGTGSNDSFTKLLLNFDGLEGSNTLADVNASNWPRKWTQQSGLGHITNVDEDLSFSNVGYLLLDGKTIYTAPDDDRFDFAYDPFTVKLRFRADFPLGIRRTLVSKGDQRGKWTFFVDRLGTGEIVVHSDTIENADPVLLDRFRNEIVARDGSEVWARYSAFLDFLVRELTSTTLYSDTVNPGWHTLTYRRVGNELQLLMDGVLEDSTDISNAFDVRGDRFPLGYMDVGPITIGGYGPKVVGYDQNDPWIGGLDRFAIDIGIAR